MKKLSLLMILVLVAGGLGYYSFKGTQENGLKNSTNKVSQPQKMVKITDEMIREKAYDYLDNKGDLGKDK